MCIRDRDVDVDEEAVLRHIGQELRHRPAEDQDAEAPQNGQQAVGEHLLIPFVSMGMSNAIILFNFAGVWAMARMLMPKLLGRRGRALVSAVDNWIKK